MNLTSTTSRSLTMLLLAAALGATACKTTVIGGGDGGGGAGGGDQGGNGGDGGGVIVGPPSAVAEYASSVKPPTPEPSGSTVGTTTGSGGGVDPNTLNLRIGNYGPTCGNSYSYACTPVTTWQVMIRLPPDLQGAGTLVPLSEPALNSFFSETGSNGSPGDCWGGGGSFIEGTLQVLSNDGATIVVRIAGSNNGIPDVAIDGDYVAPICP